MLVLTVLGGAVAVRVVAAKRHARLVSGRDTVIPAQGNGRAVSEVALDKFRVLAPAEDVVASMLSELDGFIQGNLELGAESDVTGLVDGVVCGPALAPVVRAGGRSGVGGTEGIGGCGCDGGGCSEGDEQLGCQHGRGKHREDGAEVRLRTINAVAGCLIVKQNILLGYSGLCILYRRIFASYTIC